MPRRLQELVRPCRLQELVRPCRLHGLVTLRRLRAFTLVELLVVMAIIATLLTVAVPRYLHSADRARDAALRQTLAAARDAIDKYYGDTGRYPETLQQLVDKQYLRRAPYDPVTQSDTTWVVVPPGTDRGGQSGVYDVRSGAPGSGYDGTAYADW